MFRLFLSRGPEICLLHVRVFLNLRGRSLRDLAAEIEDSDTVGHAHDQFHHVLDQKDRDAPLVKPAQPFVQLTDLLQVHPGSGFVEQQQLRFGGQRSCKFKATLLAERKIASDFIALSRPGRKTRASPRLTRALGGCRTAQPRDKALAGNGGLTVFRNPQVLPDAQMRKQADVLERSGDAASEGLVRRRIGDLRAIKHNCAGGHGEHAADQIDSCALS